LSPVLDHNPEVLLGTPSRGRREALHFRRVILSGMSVAREAPDLVEYPVSSVLNEDSSVIIYTRDGYPYMLLSQNRTFTTIPHPMGPPSVTISDCPSEPINKWNLVSFHELGTSLSSSDVYIEPCPRSTVLLCL